MGSPVIFNSGYAKLLAKLGIKLNDGTVILSGSDDPVVTNPAASNGSVYLSTLGVFSRRSGVWFKIADTSMLPAANENVLDTEIADGSALTNFTQTGLEILDTPIVLHGTKSFRLQHSTSIKSFKKFISVDKKFRGKNITLSLDVISTATNSNLNIIFRDETNAVDLSVSQVIATGSQAITATTANASASMNGMTNSVFNLLKVGMVVTGSAIPVGTTIISLNSATATATLSQNATGVSTGIRVSDLVSRKSFSVNIPNNCSSFSWSISSVVEVYAESYLDDIVIQLTSAAMTSTSVTVPKNNDTDWAPATFSTLVWQGLGTVTNNSLQVRRQGTNLQFRGRFTTGTVDGNTVQIPFPTNYGTISSLSSLGANTVNGLIFRGIASANSTMTVILQPSVSYFNVSIPIISGNISPISPTPGTSSFGNAEIEELGIVSIPIQGWSANETESKTIPLTSSQLVQTPDSYLQINGFGASLASTATQILRLTSANIVSNVGDAIQYIADSVNGDKFIALKDGEYHFNMSADFVTAGSVIGLSRNTTQVTTVYQSLTNPSERLMTSTTADLGTLNWSGRLAAGDILRLHEVTSAGINAAYSASLSFSYAGSLKQLNFSTDSKITIPTHQLRFEGASSRGSTDTAIVKFDTQAITQGDAWSVVNTAANGTVITMLKAGKLSVSTNLIPSGAGSSIQITKNQQTKTAISAVASEIMASSYIGIAARPHASSTFDVNVGDAIRVTAESAPSANVGNMVTLSLTESSIPANFSNVLPQWSQSDSSVRLNTANGNGSTNTFVRRMANNPDNLGSSISYSDSATLGSSFLINEDGDYHISYQEVFSTTAYFGISRNSVADITSIAPPNLLKLGVTPTANQPSAVSDTVYLVKGDVIRMVTDGTSSNSSVPSRASFSISKVGKPNLSSVDVTSFVNMKTKEDVTFRTNSGPQTTYTANTPIVFTGVVEDTEKLYNTTTGQYTSPITGNMTIAYYINTNVATNADSAVYVNNVKRVTSGITNNAAGLIVGATTIKVLKGDLVDVRCAVAWSAAGSGSNLSISYQKDNDSIATPTQQVSSDTMSFVFKATAIDPATDSVGTFNTYTYGAGNTSAISASAPTQTASSMNVNGILITARSFGGTLGSATPARFDIFIGKGLKSKQVDAYVNLAKVNAMTIDKLTTTTLETGTTVHYNETTGILTLDAGAAILGGVTRSVGYDIPTQGLQPLGYFVFNASKAPVLTTLPNLQMRVAYLSDVKASGTAGGSASATTTHTRTLNTIVDNTGIVTSLASNQFVLPAGTYSIEAAAPGFVVANHKSRIRNITDSTTALIGTSALANVNTAVTESRIMGEVTITSAKTFELQHYTTSASATNGLGLAVSNGENEVYAQVKITKIK